MRIPFANWQPDLQGLTNQGQQDTKNVLPTGKGGYAPVQDLSQISTTGLNAKCQGAFAAEDSTGTTNSFAGDATKLYKATGGVYADVSLAGGYTVASTEQWKFAQFGQRVLATQIGNVPQFYDLNSSSLFASLTGSPPQARHIAVVRDFVVLANTTTSPNQVVWSGFNNSGQWTAGSNQSDTQTLQNGGWINGITGGSVGWIFQERAVTRMLYAGPPTYFQFDTIENAPGLFTPGALAKVGDDHYYYSQRGFYSFNSGSFEPIGLDKVDNWFQSHLQAGTSSLISASADPSSKFVVFSFVSTDATDATNPDTLLFYNRFAKEWSYAKKVHELVYPALTEGYTLEQLATPFPILENIPVSLDSRQWTGGASYLGAFNSSHQLCSFGGANLAALMETGDQEPIEGKRALITNVVPLTDTSSATIVVRSRDRFADSTTDTAASAMQASGDCPVLSEGNIHRIQLNIAAGATWTFATGIEVEAQDAGEL